MPSSGWPLVGFSCTSSERRRDEQHNSTIRRIGPSASAPVAGSCSAFLFCVPVPPFARSLVLVLRPSFFVLSSTMHTMSHRPVHASNLPKPVGPYSPGMGFERLVFVSGQGATDPATGALVGADTAEQ